MYIQILCVYVFVCMCIHIRSTNEICTLYILKEKDEISKKITKIYVLCFTQSVSPLPIIIMLHYY